MTETSWLYVNEEGIDMQTCSSAGLICVVGNQGFLQ